MSISDYGHTEAIRLISKAKRGEARRKAIRKFIVALCASLILIALRGWVLMAMIDVIHRTWIPAMPPLGYISAVFIMIAARIVVVELIQLKHTTTKKELTTTKKETQV